MLNRLVVSALAATSAADNGIAAELTALLANADSIDRVDVRPRDVAFTIESKGETYRVTAMTHDREIVAVALVDFGRAVPGGGAYTWLARELARTRIATLEIAADGGVAIGTTSGEHLAITRAHVADGNARVSARWAAAWDSTDARE